VYIQDQLDGAEAGDASSNASSDVLTMLPARELLRRNALMRNTGLNVDAIDGRSDTESSDSSNDALMMLPAKELQEKLRTKQSNGGQ